MKLQRAIVGSLAVLLGIAGMAAPAGAVTILPFTNLDTLVKGVPFGPLTVSTFLDFRQGVSGTLTNQVYFNPETHLYTYAHEVRSNVDNVSEFNTGFSLADLGFNSVAGYSAAQFTAAGGVSPADNFEIQYQSDGTLDFQTQGVFFDTGERITFFYQSTNPPSAEPGDYNMINHRVGTAESYKPSTAVPEPLTASLAGLAGLGLLGYAKRRRRA